MKSSILNAKQPAKQQHHSSKMGEKKKKNKKRKGKTTEIHFHASAIRYHVLSTMTICLLACLLVLAV